MNVRRRIASLVAGTALVGAAGLFAAAPAHADIGFCRDMGFTGSDHNSLCARVIGIDAGSYLASRTQPRYGAPEVHRYTNGDIVEVDCWTTGDPDADGHGYRYWMGLYGAAGPKYVNDWYLDTGGSDVWKPRLVHC